MGNYVNFDFSRANEYISTEDIAAVKKETVEAYNTLMGRNGEGNDYLGWIDLPVDYDKEEFLRIKKAAEKIRTDSEVLVVIGIGGSYLGARAAIEFLNHNYFNLTPKTVRNAPEIYYAGNNLSSTYLCDLMDVIGDRDLSINVISKSGTTTEPAVAFRFFKKFMEEKYGKGAAAKRIYCTTDKARGALKTLADNEGYETFVIPDDVGGRYSVLTPVGLLPIAVSGTDIDSLMAGAAAARERCINNEFEKNDAMLYAACRNILYRKGKSVEIIESYEPSLQYICEWWKQLMGESEGKDLKGIFPASVVLTSDLHSMGQFIQDGSRIMMETILNVEKVRRDIDIESDEQNLDGLNYLVGKSLSEINRNAMVGTALAHNDGGVAVMSMNIPEQSPFCLGELFYTFEFACGVSGYMLKVNPFNQPGVESYKKNMFALLEKPGYEELTKKLKG